MMMMVTVKVPGQTTARGDTHVDSFDTVASSSGKGQAIISNTITATAITAIVIIIIIGRYGRWPEGS